MKFIDPDYKEMLTRHRLGRFADIWNAKVKWFEEPNARRGGWSGVGKLTLSQGDIQYGIFLKRQQNHQRRTMRYPFYGKPTFAFEFEMIQYLESQNVPSLKAIAFDFRPSQGGDQSILMTEELLGFESFEAHTKWLFKKNASLAEKNLVIRQVASTVSKLHRAKVRHGSLYPKHLFVSKDYSKEVAVIDLEKSRVTWLGLLRTYYDLAALNRHAESWTRSRRLYFFMQYMGLNKLTTPSKWLCRAIIKRSQR